MPLRDGLRRVAGGNLVTCRHVVERVDEAGNPVPLAIVAAAEKGLVQIREALVSATVDLAYLPNALDMPEKKEFLPIAKRMLVGMGVLVESFGYYAMGGVLPVEMASSAARSLPPNTRTSRLPRSICPSPSSRGCRPDHHSHVLRRDPEKPGDLLCGEERPVPGRAVVVQGIVLGHATHLSSPRTFNGMQRRAPFDAIAWDLMGVDYKCKCEGSPGFKQATRPQPCWEKSSARALPLRAFWLLKIAEPRRTDGMSTSGLRRRRASPAACVPLLLHYLRSDLKPVRTSSDKSCGCSQAAKCPPLATALKWMRLW